MVMIKASLNCVGGLEATKEALKKNIDDDVIHLDVTGIEFGLSMREAKSLISDLQAIVGKIEEFCGEGNNKKYGIYYKDKIDNTWKMWYQSEEGSTLKEVEKVREHIKAILPDHDIEIRKVE